MTWLRRRLDLKSERGAALLIVVLSLVAIMGMLVLTVDLGGMLVKRRSMVNAADSAALAAAGSCAKTEGATQAQQEADALAVDNVSNAAQDSFTITPDCDASKGSVSLQYHGAQPLFFAPILGFGDQTTVKAAATAIWEPAGGGNPVPIEFSLDGGSIPCKDQPIGTECNYWYDQNNNNFGSSSNWGFMNLDRWNVPADLACPNAGASQIRDWISGNDPVKVTLNQTPPTYVCVTSGVQTQSWFSTLFDQIGDIKQFPINDPAGMILTQGKEKYDIIGFTALQIENVLHGNDPVAIGTQAANGNCHPSHDFKAPPPNDTWDLDGQACNVSNLTYPNDLTKDYPKLSKGSTDFVYGTAPGPGVDYLYDPSTHVITWLMNQDVNNVKVEWDWSTPATPGKCGTHAPDPNAVCLVTTWQGYQIGGSGGGSQDFGLRAIRLSD